MRLLATTLVLLAATGAHAQREPDSLHYELDPITDTVLIALTFVSAVGSELTIRSGELQASVPGPVSNIPVYDRWVAEGHADKSGDILGNIGALATIGYALFDSVYTGFDQGSDSGWTDFVLYLESGLANGTLANIVKLTVRRPRPIAYQEGAGGDTNRELSFYSGHAAVAAGLAATASYLTFEREGPTATSWAVLLVGSAVTAFVGINRVRVGAHFPSDVFVGALTGASVGVLIPHLHRASRYAPRVSFWSDGEGGGGGSLRLQF